MAFSTSRTLAAASTNATLVKASPGVVGGYQMTNAAAYAVFVKLYDSATIPTAGAGTPKLTIAVPAGGQISEYYGGDDSRDGIVFTAGIGFTITKLVADNDTTVLVANDLTMNLLFK